MTEHNSESDLKKMTYKEIDEKMSAFPSGALLDFIDSKSIKLGDTAASLLSRRDETKMVAEAVLQGRCKNRLSKLRAAYILCGGNTLTDSQTDAFFTSFEIEMRKLPTTPYSA